MNLKRAYKIVKKSSFLVFLIGIYVESSYGKKLKESKESDSLESLDSGSEERLDRKPSGPFGRDYVDKKGNITAKPKGKPGDIRFFLYTTKDRKGGKPEELYLNDLETIKSSNFIKNAPVVILTHGWQGNLSSGFPQEAKNEYLKSAKGDLNVICTDWGALSYNPFYPLPAAEVPLVGECGAQLIMNIIHANLSKASKFHLVGHSLGAHCSGAMGMNLKKRINKTVSRITGLDPAKPLFDIAAKDFRIDKTDAKFVDIIHSTGLTVGLYLTLGHADFYPNNGIAQAGCGSDLICDHSRSHQYFTESISTPKGFKACKCPNQGIALSEGEYVPLIKDCKCTSEETTAYMGEFCSKRTRGTFSLETNVGYPFSKS